MRCLIVTPQPLLHGLLGALLVQLCGLELVPPAVDLDGAEPLIAADPPELLLLDRSAGGLEPTPQRLGQLIQASSRLILLVQTSSPWLQEAPAGMVVLPAEAPDLLLRLLEEILRLVQEGGLPRLPQAPLPDPRLLRRLAPRERTLLEGLGAGLGNRELAQRLGLSPQTAQTYRRNLSSKLGLSGSRLLRLAVLYGLLMGANAPVAWAVAPNAISTTAGPAAGR